MLVVVLYLDKIFVCLVVLLKICPFDFALLSVWLALQLLDVAVAFFQLL